MTKEVKEEDETKAESRANVEEMRKMPHGKTPLLILSLL